MALVKHPRMISRYEITKAEAQISLGLAPVIEWSQDGEYLIAEHAETTGAPLPPLVRKDRNYTLVELVSIYDTLGVPVDLRERISIGFTSTHIIFFINKEL